MTRGQPRYVHMALQTTVKISNVTNLSDARYCAGMGVDMLGFSMDESSPDYVDPARFNEIRGWLAGVQIVGETAEIDQERIREHLETYGPDMLQVDEPALLPALSLLGKPLILRLNLVDLTLDQLDALIDSNPVDADYILLESGAPLHLDDDISLAIGRLASRHAVLLGVGITAETVHNRLAQWPIKGIALTGGPEDRPGSREFGELMDILESIEID
ncbi:N-(5'-phosphoribosyl)anthranilate isomerase [Rudanella paleaurantiibacter]|uniref:N-(5'-phosphoribosyl)anthranilate isomerase n=2 Tax=Rudanella paleaurantiibacter TaxID=2614655 RepID=A0A7J5TVC4_9BACT|nr:N-(5'-phosphoribosyl)anthranilate isomerase [Rudanella paleaurantiibacter]